MGLIFYFVYVLLSGIFVINIFGFYFEVGYLYVFFVFFWVVGFLNVVNLIDGIDGLVFILVVISLIIYGIIVYN